MFYIASRRLLKALKIISFSVLITLIVANAKAQKLAVIELQTIFEQAEVAIDARKQLQTEFAPRQKVIEGKQSELELLVRDLEKNRLTLSEQQVQQQQQEIVQKRREFQRLSNEFQQQYAQTQQQTMSAIEQQIEQAVATVAKKNDFSLVLFQGIAYHQPSINITQQVLQELNKKSK